ncbi:MAG: hypothetical protein ACTHKJ_05300 [Candidatus Nitrosocosmicus sp.]
MYIKRLSTKTVTNEDIWFGGTKFRMVYGFGDTTVKMYLVNN